MKLENEDYEVLWENIKIWITNNQTLTIEILENMEKVLIELKRIDTVKNENR